MAQRNVKQARAGAAQEVGGGQAGSAADARAGRRISLPRYETVALMLQGGGALGAYQAGVYEALQDGGYMPEWIAGISIGAINAAIIAGNHPENRIDRLHRFWDRVSEFLPFECPAEDGIARQVFSEASAALVALTGLPGFFSPRFPPPFAAMPGTPAAEMQEMVPTAEMDERLARLQELIDSQQSAFNMAAIGTTVDVLFERAGRNPGQIVGRTAYLQPAHVTASTDIIGQTLPVRIERLERFSLLGELVQPAPTNWPAYSQMTIGA